MPTLSRIGPLAGVAGIGCAVAGLAMDTAPTSSWSDQRIADWYTANGSGHWLLSAYVLAAAAPFLLLFTAVVRGRLARAGASPTSLSVVLGAGTAFAVMLMTGAALYAAVPAARVFARAPAPSADISRYLLGAAYGALVMFSALASAVFAAAVSIAALRTRALPRPLAVVGVVLAVLMLANAVMPMAAITLWFLVISVAFALRPDRTTVAEPEEAVFA